MKKEYDVGFAQFIQENYTKIGVKGCADHLGISPEQVRRYHMREGLDGDEHHEWTPDEIETLQKKYPHHGVAYAAKILDLPLSVVRDKSTSMKLHLFPREKRLCIQCEKNFLDPTMRGNKCRNCNLDKKNKQRNNHATSSGYKFHEMANSTKHRAKIRGIEYELSAEFFHDLFAKQEGKCAYTGHAMTVERSWAGKKERDEYATTADRIDPTKGYTKDNVVLCCLWINVAKNRFPLDVFVENCRDFLDYHKKNF